jgi:hypothetical protein
MMKEQKQTREKGYSHEIADFLGQKLLKFIKYLDK